jgi:hypothetical protein
MGHIIFLFKSQCAFSTCSPFKKQTQYKKHESNILNIRIHLKSCKTFEKKQDLMNN